MPALLSSTIYPQPSYHLPSTPMPFIICSNNLQFTAKHFISVHLETELKSNLKETIKRNHLILLFQQFYYNIWSELDFSVWQNILTYWRIEHTLAIFIQTHFFFLFHFLNSIIHWVFTTLSIFRLRLIFISTFVVSFNTLIF